MEKIILFRCQLEKGALHMRQEQAPKEIVLSHESAFEHSMDLMQAAQERAAQLDAAKEQMKAALSIIGDDLRVSTREELSQYLRQSKSEGEDQRQQQKRDEVFHQIDNEALANDGVYILDTFEEVDYDIAGGYDVFGRYKLTKQQDLYILEYSERAKGHISGEGSFDRLTHGPTYVFSKAMPQPLSTDTFETQVELSTLAIGDFQLTSWHELDSHIKAFYNKLQTDKIADECSQLLEKQPYEKGRWDTLTRKLTLHGDYDTRWDLTELTEQVPDLTGEKSPKVTAISISQHVGGQKIESAQLDVSKGRFWSPEDKKKIMGYLAIARALAPGSNS